MKVTGGDVRKARSLGPGILSDCGRGDKEGQNLLSQRLLSEA